MAKFRIEDIVPPEKRRRQMAGRVPTAAGRAPGEVSEDIRPAPRRTFSSPPPAEIIPIEREEEKPTLHPKKKEHALVSDTDTKKSHPAKKKVHPPEEEVIEDPAPIRFEHRKATASTPPPDEDVDEAFEDTAEIVDEPHYYGYENDDRPRRMNFRFPPLGAGWKPYVFSIVGLCFLGALLAHTVFARALVTVTPKSEEAQIETKFIADKSPEDGSLGYSVMKVELVETKEVPATGTKELNAKASGKIIVYNDFSSKTQRLIKNTRFQSSAGKIYRINTSVDVPGQKTSGGKTTPGSTEVTIYADESGEAYNSAPTDFTIPGFSGDPRHEKIYARSSAPLAGGASGVVKTVSDADLKRAKEDIRIALETKLRTKARADVAPAQLVFDDAVRIELGEAKISDQAAASADRATVEQSGVLYAIIFDRATLARAIAKIIVPTYAGEPVEVSGLDAMTFTIDPRSGEELWSGKTIDFILKGRGELIFSVDTSVIRRDLAGLPKARFNELMAAYPTVERASASLRPFWKGVFPKDPDHIEVVVDKKASK